MSRPLEGVRALDLTNVIAGPLASYWLALLGAEVVKIEVPGTGDLARKMGADPELGANKMGLAFLAMNAGKKSMTINLKSDEGKAIFRRLARQSDVVIENFRPGTMERLGLSGRALLAENPRLVYCSVSGFGQSGPLAERPSYDQIIQGYCGLMSVTGEAEHGPTKAGYVVCDTAAALTAAFAIVSALHGRTRTGEGDIIDVAMLDTALSTMASWNVVNYVNAGYAPGPMGNHSQSATPSGAFRAADGLINIVNNEQGQWLRLCDALGLPELPADPRFASPQERMAHREVLRHVLETRLAEADVAHWDDVLQRATVPVGPVLSVPDAVEHAHTRSRNLLMHFETVPGVGRPIAVPRAGFHLSGGPIGVDRPPPQLGEHTNEMLERLGFDAPAIDRLRAEGVV